MNIGIILAAGKGTRLNSTTQNKTTLLVGGKPMITYGATLFQRTLDKTVVVVGAFADSVKHTLADFDVFYAEQGEQLGTGHAVKVAVDVVESENLVPDLVVVGYGDHLMYYQEEMVQQLLTAHTDSTVAISLVTTHFDDPMSLAWGRIIRNNDGYVQKIVEQKEASHSELLVTELNAGFYCFNYAFLKESLQQLQPAPVTHEYYLTDLIGIANQQHLKVVPITAPYTQVGSGINTLEQLAVTDQDFKN